MADIKTPSVIDIAVSGLRAQGQMLKVCANNMANISTTRTDPNVPGSAYRRKMVELAAGDEADLAGVTTGEIVEDMGALKPVYMGASHPDADAKGYVMMPNVDLPNEMVGMIAASRAYQANANMLRKYQESVDTALELLR
ncbi:MAG: flagellar basal body rod protein FlgC [Planctomycetes bacterium]|nr:flagellar basal body rod protein FlgC [Planctomycetota bacterium]